MPLSVTNALPSFWVFRGDRFVRVGERQQSLKEIAPLGLTWSGGTIGNWMGCCKLIRSMSHTVDYIVT